MRRRSGCRKRRARRRSPRPSDAALRPGAAGRGCGPGSLPQDHRRRADQRVIGSVLSPPDRPALSPALRRIWQGDWNIDPDDLRADLLSALEAVPDRAGEREAWRDLLGALRLGTASFAADQPAAEDALGRREEARRLAELA
ncbi:MAG: hypothetical protein NZ523_08290, partial [Elioraea sp.]|nr:hypothetical protein [Elioraea sp.]